MQRTYPMSEPTPYRVSTITCNATVSTTVKLPVFFKHVRIHPDTIVYSEFGRESKGVPVRKRPVAPVEGKKSFDNQVTVILRMKDGYYPNVKLFRNGSIQMTGVRTEADGHVVVDQIVREVRRIAQEHDPDIVGDIHELKGDKFAIRMINSDFGFPFKIRRKNLHQLLISPMYQNACSFQPLTYPGVKLQYYWNQQNKGGVCKCENACYGTGKGECKKVTVSIFDSGKVLITGANSFDQVNEAYGYICNVVRSNMQEVVKVLPH